MYVCGITPYDATHLGHAATYVTFDLVGRALRDAGHEVSYVQNVTDVDDPLFERAERDGIDWAELARTEIALFREDMTALQVIPPNHYVGAVESIPLAVKAIETLVANGAAYPVAAPDGDGHDIYFDTTSQASFGEVSSLSREEMLGLFAERGGDPDRAGKRDPLDPVLWRAPRRGEPSWPGGSLGNGRPGWHIECTTIVLEEFGMPFDIQGGGTDLVFPHHEMSASHAEAITGAAPYARMYVHQAMVGLDGAKMSKSKGNLVLVSRLRSDGIDPMAIRLALLDHHYRTPWDWTDEVLEKAKQRLAMWRTGLSGNGGPPSEATIAQIRQCLAHDLNSPGALAAIDRWAGESIRHGGTEIGAPGIVGRAADALLGIRI
jgi:L-cysteine:1D-myo-inositol 2-amino-2-deoxy-alpha-D-glucopyranoside ligase